MRLNPDHQLAPASIEFLDHLIRSSQRNPRELVPDDMLLRFVYGQCSEQESDRVVSFLARSESGRLRALDIREEAVRRRAERWSDAVSDEFRGLLSAATKQSTDLGTHRVDRDIVFRARHALRAVVANVIRAIDSPPVAFARGAEAVEAPSSYRLQAAIDDKGTLHATAEFPSRADSPAEHTRFQLEFVDPGGGAIPLGVAEYFEELVEFVVEGFGSTCGLPPGSIPPAAFRLTAGESGGPVFGDRYMAAQVDGTGEFVHLQIVETPRIEGEVFSVTLAIPASERAAYRGYALELSLPVGTFSQLVDRWLIDDWTSDERRLSAPVPGAVDGTLSCPSVLDPKLVQGSG